MNITVKLLNKKKKFTYQKWKKQLKHYRKNFKKITQNRVKILKK